MTAGAGAESIAAGSPPRALFALIVGVNASPAADLAPLQYADDDAARYLDLFRALGARAYMLSRLDENTRRLHPQAAAEAVLPRRAEWQHALEALRADIAKARQGGVPATLYVVYAGHGDVDGGGWYLTLEDARLPGADLLSEVARVGADQSHLIVDACHAYMLAMPRGAGASRRPLTGFVAREAVTRAGRIGLLLSSSVSGETHEWQGFEAGVFSHEVRSGLYGAADANGDGQVTYSEIGAFVARANADVTNDRFRPLVFARAPSDSDLLVDLRGRADHELRLEGPQADAHYLLEDAQGVRLLDFHGSASAPAHLIRPPGDGLLYLRRIPDGGERTVPHVDSVVELAALPEVPGRAQTRGAAHEAFARLFTLAFDSQTVSAWDRHQAEVQARFDRAERDEEEARARAWRRKILGISALAVAAGAATGATLFELSARRLHDDAPARENHDQAVSRNDRIDTRNDAALGLGMAAAAAAASGLVLLLWPSAPASTPMPEVAVVSGGGRFGAGWHF
jgi:hypothetical protein